MTGTLGPSSSVQARSAMPASASELGALAAAERVAVAPDEQRGLVVGERRDREVVGPGRAVGDERRRRGAAVERFEHARIGDRLAARREDARRSVRSAVQSARNSARISPTSVSCSAVDGRRPRTAAPPTRARRGAGRGSARPSRTSSTLTPSTSSISRTRIETAAGSRSSTANSSTATPSPCSSTSMPTMSPSTAPMRDATRPSAPGRSGSQTRIRTWRSLTPTMVRAEDDASVSERVKTRTHPYTRPVWSGSGCSAARSIPCTSAHIVVAVETRAALDLDRVLLVVAGDPWQKRGRVVASAATGSCWWKRAVDGVDGVEASSIEVERDGASVTADTLEALVGPAPRAVPRARRRRGRQHGARGGGSTRRATSPRSSSSSASATRTRSPRVAGGRSSGCRSRASTSRRPTCATAWPPGARSTAWSRRPSCTPSRRTGLYTGGR